jgi:hypothetical protein
MSERLDLFDQDLEEKKKGFLDDLSRAVLPSNLLSSGANPELPNDGSKDDLLLRRTAELRAGLR